MDMSSRMKDLAENDKLVKKEIEDLMKTPGWARLMGVLQDSVDHFTYQLKNNQFESIEDVRILQYKISATEKLMGIGDLMITIIDQQSDLPILDPFETVQDQIDNLQNNS